MKKRLVMVLMCATMILSNNSFIFASEIIEGKDKVNTNFEQTDNYGDFLTDQDESVRGINYPSKSWDLSDEDYVGSVQFRNKVITNYYFEGNTDLYVTINFSRDIVYGNSYANVVLYSDGYEVEKKTFTCGTSTVNKTFHFSNLDSNKKYAIEFNKGSSDGSEITGTFRITN